MVKLSQPLLKLRRDTSDLLLPANSIPIYFVRLAWAWDLFLDLSFILINFRSAGLSYLNFFFFFFGLSLFGLSLVHTFLFFPACSFSPGFSPFAEDVSPFTCPSELPCSSFSVESPVWWKPSLDMPTDSTVTVVYLSSSTYSSSWFIVCGSSKPSHSSPSSPKFSASLPSLVFSIAFRSSALTVSTCFSRSSFRWSRIYE